MSTRARRRVHADREGNGRCPPAPRRAGARQKQRRQAAFSASYSGRRAVALRRRRLPRHAPRGGRHQRAQRRQTIGKTARGGMARFVQPPVPAHGLRLTTVSMLPATAVPSTAADTPASALRRRSFDPFRVRLLAVGTPNIQRHSGQAYPRRHRLRQSPPIRGRGRRVPPRVAGPLSQAATSTAPPLAAARHLATYGRTTHRNPRWHVEVSTGCARRAAGRYRRQ